MINKNIKASPAKKQNGAIHKRLTKIEGILTSKIELKYQNNQPYYLAFFQFKNLDQDIPVIFKSDNSLDNPEAEKPAISPRSKVLLEGKWAKSNGSSRPSFTCLAYEILANPSPPTIKSLREQISQLLKVSLDKKKEWTQRTDYLFKRIDYLNDLQKLTKLGEEYLKAYLLLKSASYANYQDNLLPETTDLTHQATFLAKIQSELEDIACQVRAYQSKEI